MGNQWIDIHTHILPGLDDGARTVADALEMAQIAVECGVHTVVATPHSHTDTQLPPGYAAMVESRVRALQYRLRCEGIPLRVLPGMEIFATPETAAQLAGGELLSLAGTRYALVEFTFEEDPLYIREILRTIRHARFVPVVAHPERYACVNEMPQVVGDWLEDGCLTQINKGSPLGRFGEPVQKTAEYLLNCDWVTLVASDAHAPFARTPNFTPLLQYFTEIGSEDAAQTLLADSPQRILQDERFK